MSNHQEEIIKCENAGCGFEQCGKCTYIGRARINPDYPPACQAWGNPCPKPPITEEDLRKAKERQEAYDRRWYYLTG